MERAVVVGPKGFERVRTAKAHIFGVCISKTKQEWFLVWSGIDGGDKPQDSFPGSNREKHRLRACDKHRLAAERWTDVPTLCDLSRVNARVALNKRPRKRCAKAYLAKGQISRGAADPPPPLRASIPTINDIWWGTVNPHRRPVGGGASFAILALCPNHSLYKATKRLVIDVIVGVVGFPLWWYTRGLVRFARFVWQTLADYQATLGIVVWVKNIFVPMYGSYDIPGRIISFFMRLAMILFRGIALIILFLIALAVVIVPRASDSRNADDPLPRPRRPSMTDEPKQPLSEAELIGSMPIVAASAERPFDFGAQFDGTFYVWDRRLDGASIRLEKTSRQLERGLSILILAATILILVWFFANTLLFYPSGTLLALEFWTEPSYAQLPFWIGLALILLLIYRRARAKTCPQGDGRLH